ncbi:MAG TPA: M6 family metalloprotease domain-containing protein, partial [Paludibacter sp.]
LSKLYAVPATPNPITIQQADGTEITIRLRGDEFFNYKTTLDGYTLIPDDTGILTYAQADMKGKLYSSKVKANNAEKRNLTEKFFVQGLSKNISYTKQNMASRVKRVANSAVTSSAQKSYPLRGAPKSLVILVNFNDLAFVVPAPKIAFSNLLTETGYSGNGGTGSARDYFRDNSMGVFDPQFDVVGPYKLPQAMAYYGENDASGLDKDPRQMVIDACKLASENGVNFSDYDTDKDGIVDNVFIYYAGYNEAEGAPANTVWPHRWSLENYNTKFNGVSVYDYACTSELRSKSGSNMCGVGTFCHEFGHVLGLPDYYATNDAKHQTLSYWNIMDNGPYLNLGRTPPSYSAFDRFYLNWLVPTEIKKPGLYTLDNLNAVNKAYLFTQYGNHNLVGSNPSPVEFFTLENRQNISWDSYLPGHGMLVSHIYYSATDWADNSPNNNALAMGYDIVEADGIANDATLSGDPFPGTKNVKFYTPLLRDKTDIDKPLTNISETNGIIQFMFDTNILLKESIHSFSTVQGILKSTDIQTVTVSGSKLTENIYISFDNGTHFEMKKETDPETAWGKSITLISGADSIVNSTIIQIRYNPTVPSYSATHDDKLILKSGVNDYAEVILTGRSTRQIYVVPPTAIQSTDVTFSGFIANWNNVFDASGYYLTVYNITDGESSLIEGFDNGVKAPTNWIITPVNISNSTVYSGLAVPSLQFANNGEKVVTEKYMTPVVKLSFYLRSMGGTSGGFVVEGQKEQGDWFKIDSIPVTTALSEKSKTYSFLETDNYTQFRFTYIKGSGSVTFDDVTVNFSKKISYIERDKWLTTTSDFILNLAPLSEYIVKVRASDKNTALDYENITDFSNAISTFTLKYPLEKKLLALVDMVGNIKVYFPDLENTLYVYTLSGKCMRVIVPSSNIIEISDLPRGQTYILKAANRAIKVTLY